MKKLASVLSSLLFSIIFTFSAIAAEELNVGLPEGTPGKPSSAGAVKEKDPYQLDEVIVTATRYGTLLANTPDTVQVITREDIEEINPTSTAELFMYITGTSFESGTGSGLPDRGIIGLDGLSADRTLVLVDGVKLLTEHIHTGQNIEFIPPQSIERIEILRGAGSAQYGSDAIGGVINIITRKARNKTEIDFGFKTGSYGYYDTGMSLLTPIGKNMRFSHFLSWEQSDGVNIEAPAHRKDYMGYDRLNSFNRIDIDFSNDTSVFGVWNYILNTMDWSSEPYRLDSDLGSQVLGLNQRISDELDLTIHAGYSSWDAEQSDEKNKLFEPQVFLNWRGLENHTIVTGIDYKYNEFERTSVSSYDQSAYALFLQDTWQLSEEWFVTGSLRWDKYEGVSSAVSPKLSVLYKPSRFRDTYRIRASIGRSFHAPTLQELYEEGYGHGGRARRYGNPNLDPEYATNYSLGLEVNPEEPFSTTWRVFRTDFDDMIVPYYEGEVPGDPAHDVWRRMNIAEATVYGAEASLRWRINNSLELDAGCTYTENKREDTDGHLPYTAGTTTFAKMIFTHPVTRGVKMRAFVGAHNAVNRKSWSWKPGSGMDPDDASGLVTPLDDYINLTTGLSFFFGDRLELLFRADNLLGEEIATLDDVYTVREGNPAYYVGLNYRISF